MHCSPGATPISKLTDSLQMCIHKSFLREGTPETSLRQWNRHITSYSGTSWGFPSCCQGRSVSILFFLSPPEAPDYQQTVFWNLFLSSKGDSAYERIVGVLSGLYFLPGGEAFLDAERVQSWDLREEQEGQPPSSILWRSQVFWLQNLGQNILFLP